MSMTIIDNFSLKGKSFMDGRQSVATVAALKAVPETDVPDGFRAYCAETKRWYEYNSANTVHSLFGRWRLADEQLALGAVEGTGNVITEITVEDNVIKPKKGATMVTEEEFHALDVAFDTYKEQMTDTLADKADKSDITAVLTNLDGTNTNVSKNATAINTLAERADSLDNDIANINQYASEQNTRITDLETEKANNSTVTALATRVSSLEAAEPDSIPVSEIEALFA